MAEKYDNNNKAALWEREGRNGLFYSGTVNVEGKDYDLTLFINDDTEGRRPALSGKVTKIEDRKK